MAFDFWPTGAAESFLRVYPRFDVGGFRAWTEPPIEVEVSGWLAGFAVRAASVGGHFNLDFH